jgi:hypothetical protein
LKLDSLLDVLAAFHLSSYVESPMADRGGIAIVAPPGSLKSSIIISCFEDYPDTLALSDIDAKTLNALTQDFETGRYHTLALPDFEKIYQRNPATASNAEGVIAALVAQGRTEASYDDHRTIGLMTARAAVCLGMVPSVVKSRITEWIENGFARRFLWVNYQLHNPRAITEAIHNWSRIEFSDNVAFTMPSKKGIPSMEVTPAESRKLEKFIKAQYDTSIPLLIMRRILVVLKWKYKDEPRRPMEILLDFSESLGKNRARLEI